MRLNGLKSLLVACFSLFWVLISLPAAANEEVPGEKLNPAKVIMEHIQDSHEFHLDQKFQFYNQFSF